MKLSHMLRRHLKKAGVTRHDLFQTDRTRRAIRFYDLRATGITWMAVRGDEPIKIQRRAGHADFEMTQEYIREAENLSGDAFGGPFPFPPLPDDLLRARIVQKKRTTATNQASCQRKNGGGAGNRTTVFAFRNNERRRDFGQ